MITIIVFRTSQRLCFTPICIRPMSLTSASSLLIIQLYPTCKNVQYPSYTKKHTIILYYYGMFQCGGVFTLYFIGTFAPGWGCVQLTRQLQKLYQVFTQFTKPPQIHFDSHFDKILKIQAKINFLTI